VAGPTCATEWTLLIREVHEEYELGLGKRGVDVHDESSAAPRLGDASTAGEGYYSSRSDAGLEQILSTEAHFTLPLEPSVRRDPMTSYQRMQSALLSCSLSSAVALAKAVLGHGGAQRSPSRPAPTPVPEAGQPVFIPGSMGASSFVPAGEPGSDRACLRHHLPRSGPAPLPHESACANRRRGASPRIRGGGIVVRSPSNRGLPRRRPSPKGRGARRRGGRARRARPPGRPAGPLRPSQGLSAASSPSVGVEAGSSGVPQGRCAVHVRRDRQAEAAARRERQRSRGPQRSYRPSAAAARSKSAGATHRIIP
jgi:hypothetical protein